jgi:hypothetical protein
MKVWISQYPSPKIYQPELLWNLAWRIVQLEKCCQFCQSIGLEFCPQISRSTLDMKSEGGAHHVNARWPSLLCLTLFGPIPLSSALLWLKFAITPLLDSSAMASLAQFHCCLAIASALWECAYPSPSEGHQGFRLLLCFWVLLCSASLLMF